jgi:hypothetical protein
MYVRVSILFRSTILRTVPTVWCGVFLLTTSMSVPEEFIPGTRHVH